MLTSYVIESLVTCPLNFLTGTYLLSCKYSNFFMEEIEDFYQIFNFATFFSMCGL